MRLLSIRPFLFSLWIFSIGIALYLFPQSQTQVGYAALTADSGMRIPVASALFTYTNASGVMVCQAGVGAADPISSGRIFVDQNGTETGFALVNPSSQSASINLILRSSAGNETARQPLTLEAGRHTARFVSEFFRNLPAGFTGSLTFESTQKLAAITLRQSTNAQGEPLYTTLPVLDLSQPSIPTPVIFPQIAAGDGYSTQILLINPTSGRQTGTVSLVARDGTPLDLTAATGRASQFRYDIPAQGAFRMELERDGAVAAGYAVVIPEGGSTTPSGSAVFRYKANGTVVTEAGVGGTRPTTSARIFVDNADTYTGVALANTEPQPAAVSLTLLDKNGVEQETVVRNLAAKGHLAVFAHELFPGLDSKFHGLMEITSTTPVSSITLKLTINQRNDLVYTTLPVADLNNTPASTRMLFPQIAFGGGFSTRLICINTDKAKNVSGKLNFYRSDSTPMILALGNQTASQFPYQLSTGGGMQFFPGNTAKIASISIVDPSTNLLTTEIAVNEGNTIKASLLVLDETGTPRDDFVLNYTSTNPDAATVDANGSISGKKAGFSTLMVSSGGAIVTGTISVVGVRVGMAGYQTKGVVQDLSNRLYLAATDDNTILLAQALGNAPEIYAGVRKTAGYKNDRRLQSLFRKPAFLAFDQAQGTLYVSDGENHVVRRIQAGPDGKVETFTGTGEKGSADGSLSSATFNNPQGLALDYRGYLWVVDSGNHTVRRINLTTGTVSTVAGKPGSPGWADGKGDGARFSNPVGIAVEPESPVVSFLSGAPKPVSVVVADTGNGLIRRVNESGEVETFGSAPQSLTNRMQSSSPGVSRAAPGPLVFRSPIGVAVDHSGTVFVAEPGRARVSAILTNGKVVATAEARTFHAPAGMAVTQSGRILVADGENSAVAVTFGGPQIKSITPGKISVRGGDRVTIKGANFSPDSFVVVSGTLIRDFFVKDTQTIEFTAQSGIPSGKGTVTVQNRGGIAQTALLVEPAPLSELPPGFITTYAGGLSNDGDGSLATDAYLKGPQELALDSHGSLFVADVTANRVRKISSETGIITSVVGTGEGGFSGDGGPATAAQITGPQGVVLDSAGNLLIADFGNLRVRKVAVETGIITTVAGTGEAGLSGDGGPATSAKIGPPLGLALDSAGNLYVADGINVIRKITAATGIIATLAGTGQTGFSGDGGPATAATFAGTNGIAVNSRGDVFVADSRNNRVRRIAAETGIITTMAGTGQQGFSGDGGPAASARLYNPNGLAIDAADNLFVTDSYNNRIRKIDSRTGVITTVAGPTFPDVAGLPVPMATAVDSGGNLLVAINHCVLKVASATGGVTKIAGVGDSLDVGDGGPAGAAMLYGPNAVAVDSTGNLFISDLGNGRIRKVAAATGIITTTATKSYSSDLVVNPAGDLFFSDSYTVRKIAGKTGEITTVAGTGQGGFSGDGGPATAARIISARGLGLDSAGNLYIALDLDCRIRMVAASTGIIMTLAGTGEAGFSGDGGAAISAKLNFPSGVAVDTGGNVYISDLKNNRVRKIAAGTGIITTFAGNGDRLSYGDGGPATAAGVPVREHGVAMDREGNLIIMERNKIRKVVLSTGIITTLAGSGVSASSGDGGPASAAGFFSIGGVAIDTKGNIFVADSGANRIRVIRGPIP